MTTQIDCLPRSLRYSSDSEPGFSSTTRGKTRKFFDPKGNQVSDTKQLARLNGLAIPPAYEDIWICRDARGHLQMTGRDVAGRKQYRYHEDWSTFRAKQKYNALPAFGAHLPKLRRRVSRDLRRSDVDSRFVTAALVRLIDTAALRIGNAAYTDSNNSYGATTLRQKHIKLSETSVKLDFRAKGGKRVRKVIKDRTLNRVLESIDDLPGRDIFQYVNANGDVSRIDSSQVNEYLGENFTAKTFRTWHGTVAAFTAAEKADGRVTLKLMSEAAAKRLHNTPSICRSSYIHPAVIKLAELESQELEDTFCELRKTTQRMPGLKAYERRCLNLISTQF